MHIASHRALACAAMLATALPAQADRPINGDMASTADAGTCQVELWQERASPDRAWVVAPACGLLPGLELGVDHAALHPRDPVRSELGVGLKWAPANWKLGEATFGLKVGAGWAQPAQGSWQRTEIGAFALASVQLAPAWSVHFNAGRVRDRASGLSGNLGYAGLVWTPTEQLMLFADLQFNNRKDVFGGRVGAGGVRWWLLPEKLGLDLTAARESGSGGPTRWSVGLGWYGIGS